MKKRTHFVNYNPCLIVKQNILENFLIKVLYKDISDGFTCFFGYAIGNAMMLTKGLGVLYIYRLLHNLFMEFFIFLIHIYYGK